MDDLDVRILRTMGFRPFERAPRDPDSLKAAHIARLLGEPVNTVKDRIARMEESGLIHTYQVFPNLHHLGLSASAFYFRVGSEDDKDPILAGIRDLGGLLEVHDFLGRGVCADFAYRDEGELSDKLQRLSKVTGDDTPLRFYERELPRVEGALSALDWRILKALRGNAKRPLSEVADAIGASTRHVARRYDRMAGEGSFFAVPVLNPGRAEGIFIFDLLVFFEDGAPASLPSALVTAFNGQAVYSYVPASTEFGHFDLLLFARTTAEVEELRLRALALKGVARAETWFFRGFTDHSDWIDRAIDERLNAD